MFVPGGGGGSLLWQPPGRCRGSPTGGWKGDLLTGLSAAAGVTNQLFLDSGSTLDKVGHGACQLGVRMALAEHLPELGEVRDIMFSWMRPIEN